MVTPRVDRGARRHEGGWSGLRSGSQQMRPDGIEGRHGSFFAVRFPARELAASLLCAWSIFAIGPIIADAHAVANWRFAGHDISDSRTQPLETLITTANVGSLAPKWVFATHGNVSATPTVAGGVVYFPDSAAT